MEDDDQRKFVGYDSDNYNEGYSISMEFSEDFSSVTIDLKCYANRDLSMWGGTKDGHLTATYTLKRSEP